jgi:hypothetical protein
MAKGGLTRSGSTGGKIRAAVKRRELEMNIREDGAQSQREQWQWLVQGQVAVVEM